MVDPGDRAQVVDMVRQLRDRRLGRGMRGFPRGESGFGLVRPALEQRLLPRLFGRTIGVPLAQLFRHVARVADRHHDPAVVLQPRKHFVRYVAAGAVNRAGARVAEDHRCARGVERIHHRAFADVRQVDQHPQPVHLAHHVVSEIGQAAVCRIVGRAVGPRGVLEMGQGEVTHPQRIELPQHAQARADRVPALDSDQRRDFACFHRLRDLVCAGRELHLGGITGHQPLDRVDLLERFAHRLGFGQVGRDIGGPELRADVALAHPREVGLHPARAVSARFRMGGVAKVEIGEHIPVAIAQLFGDVVMPVPHRRFLERRLSDLLGSHRRRGGRRRREAGDQREAEQRLHQIPLRRPFPALAAAGRDDHPRVQQAEERNRMDRSAFAGVFVLPLSQ